MLLNNLIKLPLWKRPVFVHFRHLRTFTPQESNDLNEHSHPFMETKEQDPKQTEISKRSVKVAIIGVPNAGKSTFINNLLKHRICPTSSKVHTTRDCTRAVYTKNNTQLVVFDTPGLVTEREIKKHHLENSFKTSPDYSLKRANIIGVLHDVSNTWTRKELHPTVLQALKEHPSIPSFLILNKIDMLKSKRVLLDLVQTLTNNTLALPGIFTKLKRKADREANKENEAKDGGPMKEVGYSNFSEVFMVSSLTGDGVDRVLSFILKQAKINDWEFAAEQFTDKSPETLIVESVRARLLDYLTQEIPYLLKTELEHYTVEKGTIICSVIISCPNPRIERLVCGVSNGKLKQITERITSDLVETFNKPISLTLVTRCPK